MSDTKPILVVDDDTDILSLITFVLEAEGYSVSTASDGRAGLEEIERHLPRLVLLDMKMPVMNGWEFVREVRLRHDSAVPIVIVTASADAREVAQEVGAVGWIAKPFDLDQLVRLVAHHCSDN